MVHFCLSFILIFHRPSLTATSMESSLTNLFVFILFMDLYSALNVVAIEEHPMKATFNYSSNFTELIDREYQIKKIAEKERECYLKMLSEKSDPSYCPVTWDKVLCWPATPPETQAYLRCPYYIYMFNTEAFAIKKCTVNGTWFVLKDKAWTNYTACSNSERNSLGISSFPVEDHTPAMKLIAKIGYSVSLFTLIIAFLIFSLNKRLHCPRNNLHLQLFLSFIIRALIAHLREPLLERHLDSADSSGTVICKIIVVVWQYSLLANYNWLLMEGLYLHNLVFLNIFNDNSSIIRYILLGWSLPVLFIIPWTIARMMHENTYCWVFNKNTTLFWIVRGPITLSIILNLVFFINITRVIFLKMFSTSSIPHSSSCYRYSKWFKSTLVLVPLFGVHYALLLICQTLTTFSKEFEVVWLYFDLLFTSFQGFFVALLYCFLNGEVQMEINKCWSRRHSGQLDGRDSLIDRSILTRLWSFLTCPRFKERTSRNESTRLSSLWIAKDETFIYPVSLNDSATILPTSDKHPLPNNIVMADEKCHEKNDRDDFKNDSIIHKVNFQLNSEGTNSPIEPHFTLYQPDSHLLGDDTESRV